MPDNKATKIDQDIDGEGIFIRDIKADFLAEGNETIDIKLFDDAEHTEQIGNSVSLVIN